MGGSVKRSLATAFLGCGATIGKAFGPDAAAWRYKVLNRDWRDTQSVAACRQEFADDFFRFFKNLRIRAWRALVVSASRRVVLVAPGLPPGAPRRGPLSPWGFTR